MIQVGYQGWLQCRLASDPDPSDDPRGVSGCSFATVGEPDLDRIIRLQEPVVQRSHMPRVGVEVTSVRVDGSPVADHPWIGAAVEWLDGAKFEEQNGVAVQPNHPVIEPFHFSIRGAGVELRRRAVFDPERPQTRLYDLTMGDPAVKARQPLELKADDTAFLDAAGVGDPATYLATRRTELEAELEDATDPVAQAALQQRVGALEESGFCAKRNLRLLGVKIRYAFPLNAADGEIMDRSGGTDPVDETAPWPVEFWIGAWDNDTLCAFLQGTLSLPTK